MSLIARATPTLLEGKFEIADPLNTVRPPPFPGRAARLLLWSGSLTHSPLTPAFPPSPLLRGQVTQPPKGTLVFQPLEKPHLQD